MAESLQQKVRYRKLTYWALIVVFFTGSLLYRRYVIAEQAKDLLLREVDRGEVQLTGSAVRLLLTGSRGLAVTFLWYDMQKKFQKHKWNEVELLTDSITELQPYFQAPWQFLTWNVAFNAAVECDRPRDKYYYITRGLDRLAAGERRNAVPGSPDLRHSLGVSYQMKIGTSDEKMTMRSLLDLSCIDPVDRDPNSLLKSVGRGREINQEKFEAFCRANPRLVRRLHDQLGYNPNDVITFLSDNRDLPSRYLPIGEKTTLEGKSVLRHANEQWPILPPKARERHWKDWPDATVPDFGLGDQSFDIFLVSRTWHAYSQDNLPPPDAKSGWYDPALMDSSVHRIPRRPTLIIFRGYPARAQVFMAETLQEEGWFDDGGWFVKDWFKDERNDYVSVVVGNESKYHSGRVWERGYDRYRDYGKENGLYVEPKERTRLPKAQLDVASANRSVTNFDALLHQCEAESTPQAVAAHKLFHLADEFRRQPPPVTMVFSEFNKETNQYEAKEAPLLKVYDRAIELWLGVLLRFPGARRIQTLQEDTYEMQLKYIRYFQEEAGVKDLLGIPVAQPLPGALPVGQHPILWKLAEGRWNRVRDFRGPFDMTMAINSLEDADEQQLKTFLVWWASAGDRYLALHPHLSAFQLSFMSPRNPPLSPTWTPVVNQGAVNVVRSRYRGLAPQVPDTPPSPPQQAPPQAQPLP